MKDVYLIFHGRDGDATRSLYEDLFKIGPAGAVAVNALRVSKNSRGGKNSKYSGRGRRSAYESKDWAMGELCRELVKHADDLGISWGWGFDEKAIGFEHVLYVELPGQGQISFHTDRRRDGHDYPGEWDGLKDVSAVRVVRFAQFILNGGNHDEGDRTEGENASGDARGQGEPQT